MDPFFGDEYKNSLSLTLQKHDDFCILSCKITNNLLYESSQKVAKLVELATFALSEKHINTFVFLLIFL